MTTVQDSPARPQGLATLAETLGRRKVLALVPFVFVLAAAASLAFFLPSVWRARAVVMVNRQQIPEAFVKSTVVSDVESRLLTLSQEILSRPRLVEIIERHNLYADRRATQTPDELVDRMRKDIRIELADQPGDRRARDRDGRSLAFTVGYTASHPVVAAEVANTLASLYIEENGKLRERQAAGTSDFLDTQLTEVRKKLTTQEGQIAAYKEKHIGELPEQRDTNLRTLERLHQQLQSVQENHRRALERRQMITQSLAELDLSAGTDTGPAPSRESTTQARLTLLRQELAQAQTKFSDKYPDIVYLKDQIRVLEAQVAADAAQAAALPAKVAKDDGKRLRPVPQNAYVQSLMNQLDQANLEAKAGVQQVNDLQRQIGMYQGRLERTPKREHELSLITRDYESTRELFRSLLAKREEAGIATDLEHRQKGETFRVMEAAGLPDRPLGPNRIRLLLIGLVLAAGTAGAAVILAENVDTSFRRVDELRAKFTVPVLSAIPRITTDRDRRRIARQRRMAAAAVGLGLVVLIGSSYAIARNNQELVSLLTPDSGPAARR
jgi:polysaccharide chain length determinant protein (PEP-CTERM system associated)